MKTQSKKHHLSDRKRKNLKGEHTRARVQEIALKTFKENGFENTSLRQLAERCNISLGAFYYYFNSKEEIILELYNASALQFQSETAKIFAEDNDFQSCLQKIFTLRIETLSQHRELFKVLAKHALDLNSPISPYSTHTKAIREISIGEFRKLIAHTRPKLTKELEESLPTLLWAMMMGLILFWLLDSSKDQNKTKKIISFAVNTVARLLSALNIPLIGQHLIPINEIMSLFASTAPEKKT